jgi:hypothetical protein
LYYLPRIQKEDGTKASPTFGIKHRERGQSHSPLASTFAIIILKPTFVSNLQPSPRIPSQLPQISLAIQLHAACKPNPYTIASNHLSFTTFANNIPNYKNTNIPTKNRAKQSTSTPSQESSQQATSFPTFGTIHTITGGSNLTFKNKRQK